MTKKNSVQSYIQSAYYLSFPVAIGAVLSNRLATRLSDVEPIHWATPIVLALAVWLIYTVDRLLDVQKSVTLPTERHLFHRQHWTLLWRVVIGGAVLAGLLACWLPVSVLKFGFVIGVLCAAYLAVVYRLPTHHPLLLFKEPLVAVLFSVGVWGSVWVQRPTVRGVEWAEASMFLAVAFQNLLLFSVLEQAEYPGVSQVSLATYWGSERCEQLLHWLTFGVVASALIICFVIDEPGGTARFAQRAGLMMGVMSLVLAVIQRYPAYFLKNERYRWLGDGIFWLPALVL